MNIFGKSNFFGVPKDPSTDPKTKKDRLARDFGGGDTPSDTGNSAPEGGTAQITFGVVAVVKQDGKESVFPADQLLPGIKEAIPFGDPLIHLQLMLDSEEVVLKTYEINSTDSTSKPATDQVVADAMVGSFLQANGLRAPQHPADVGQLQQELKTAKERVAELETTSAEQQTQITDLTAALDKAVEDLGETEDCLTQANTDLQAAQETLTEAQTKIEQLTEASETATVQVNRLVLHLKKMYAADVDPSKLDAKGDIVQTPDLQLQINQLLASLQSDPANQQNIAMATMLSAMSGMFQQTPPQPQPPVPAAP